jgi:hypothetical protein
MFKDFGFKFSKCTFLAAVLLLSFLGVAQAEGMRCVVIHVPQADPKAFKQAVNIASNLPKQLGVDNVKIELAAQGPGLALLTQGSPEAERIESLIAQSENTMGGGNKEKDRQRAGSAERGWSSTPRGSGSGDGAPRTGLLLHTDLETLVEYAMWPLRACRYRLTPCRPGAALSRLPCGPQLRWAWSRAANNT